MRKQVIAAAAAIVLSIATTASGTIAFARGGGESWNRCPSACHCRVGRTT